MKKISITKSSMPPIEEYMRRIEPLWESRWLSNAGALHNELIAKLKDYLQVEHFELFNNGHLALEIALQTLGMKGEVITTPFTFLSTTNAIVRSGLQPVFCDIDADTWTIDTQNLRNLITKDTVAIMPVHVYGIPCNVEELEKIAKEYNLKLIYDAAHAFGAKYKGKSFASFGDISMFSFHATKVFHTVEGGGLSFQDADLAEKTRRFRDFGLCPGGADALYFGTNAKLSEFHSAMGLCNLEHLEEELVKRGRCSNRYDEHLKGVRGLKIFPDIPYLQRNFAYYPLLLTEDYDLTREELVQKLSEKEVLARKYFYPLTNCMSNSAGLWQKMQTPIAAYVSERVLCLPLFADLEEENVDRICDIILG